MVTVLCLNKSKAGRVNDNMHNSVKFKLTSEKCTANKINSTNFRVNLKSCTQVL